MKRTPVGAFEVMEAYLRGEPICSPEEFDNRVAENARLKLQLDNAHKAGFEAGELANKLAAELEALRPKPPETVVQYRYSRIRTTSSQPLCDDHCADDDNLKLTFHDGKLVSAEVIK